MRIFNKLGAAIGGMLEWYDFAIYAYFSIAISNAFFPHSIQPYLRLIYTYGIFAITYLVRPLGALIFGYIADRYGRRVVLRITPIVISLASVAIAILPDYSKIGVLASLGLILARVIQGLCLGGDFCGSIVYLVESSKKRKFLHGSFGSCIGSCGILLASIISTGIYNGLGDVAANNYGWRIAFGFSLLFGIIIYLLRRNLSETEEYIACKTEKTKSVQKFYWKNITLGTLIIAIHAATFYYFFVFLPSFIVRTTGATEKAALIHNSFFLLVHIAFIPIFGWLSDKFNGRNILIINYVILLLIMYPLITNINLADGKFTFLLWIASILTAVNAGVIPTLISSLFSTESRCLNFGLSFNLGFSIFGGITPVLCLWLFQKTGNHVSIVVYLITLVLLSLFAVLIAGGKNERRRKLL